MNSEHLLPLFVAVPLSIAFLLPLVGLINERLAPAFAAFATVALFVMSLNVIGAGELLYAVGGWQPPFGICLVGDALSYLFLLMIATVSLLIIVFSFAYMKRYTAGPRFYCLFLLMITGMNGVVISGDLFNIYVFLEIASFASYALVAFGIDREELEASFKYLVLGGIGSSFILFGIALMYSVTGTLNLADMSRCIIAMENKTMLGFISALFLTGFGLKAALVPFHAWLPDAHPSAPAPISAMLSGLLIKTLGVYALVRIFFNVIGVGQMLSTAMIVLGILSMVIGAVLAIGQWDFKRMLAYSSISQIGYIVFAFGLGTPLAYIGALFHLLNHAVFKSLLFLCSGSVEYATGTRDLRRLGGLWKKMPITSATCTIGALAISGMPPLGGFFSKLIIAVAAVQAVNHLGPIAYIYAAITVAVSFLTIVYFVKLQKMALFGETPQALESVREVPASMWGSLVMLAILCLAFGLHFPWFIERLIEPASEILVGRGDYIIKVLGSL